MREIDERRQLRDGFLEAREPQRDARRLRIERALQRAEGAHIVDDAVEGVLAAHRLERLRVGGVERDAQLVEPAIDEIASAPLVEQRAVAVEQDAAPPRL